MPGQDPSLVLFVDLALSPIEFQPIAVLRNVAPGDHDRRDPEAHAMVGERRRGKSAAIERDEPGFLQGRTAELGNARAARAQIPSDQHEILGGSRRAILLEHLGKSAGIGKSRRAVQLHHKTSQSARAKLQGRRCGFWIQIHAGLPINSLEGSRPRCDRLFSPHTCSWEEFRGRFRNPNCPPQASTGRGPPYLT